jgi:hypothetical protein
MMSVPHVGTDPQSSGPGATWFAPVSRAAFAAKGVLYLLVAAVVVRSDVAFPSAFSLALFVAVAIGLFIAAVYKLLEALAHPDVAGRGVDVIVTRLGRVAMAMTYGALGIGVLDHVANPPSVADVHWTARLLEQPLGPTIVASVGLVAMGFGLHQLYRARSNDCVRHLVRPMGATTRRLAIAAGDIAYAGRGVAVALVGIAVIRAAVTFDARVNYRGLAGVIGTVHHTSGGALSLAVFVVGCAAYGLFCILVLARYSAPGCRD